MKKMILLLFPCIVSALCCTKKSPQEARKTKVVVINPVHTVLERTRKYGPEDFETVRKDISKANIILK